MTSPRVAPGMLTWDAWSALRSGPVFTADQDHPHRPALEAAGVAVEAVDPTLPPVAVARLLRATAREAGAVTWLAGPGGDEPVVRALGEVAMQSADAGDPVEIEVLTGSWDLPGARLLDVVATMDRLRSPGGCPWDAKQTHETLAPYLLEEAYEAFEAIEERDHAALLEELGDVLLQVAFHARVAEEHDEAERWSIDDVAAGLVDKLVRRHPHVFGDRQVTDAAEVQANWDVIKAAEKAGRAPLAGVPMSMAALTLAATLQRKATKAGLSPQDIAPELLAAQTAGAAVGAAAAAYDDDPSVETAGALLWTVVAALRSNDIDAEAALRGRAREFRDDVAVRLAQNSPTDPPEPT
ncbi:MAG TPA: MazG family protein [Mycobacteriales bacterium]|nr:MazG family protein [Mycobacteriales bacterium]